MLAQSNRTVCSLRNPICCFDVRFCCVTLNEQKTTFSIQKKKNFVEFFLPNARFFHLQVLAESNQGFYRSYAGLILSTDWQISTQAADDSTLKVLFLSNLSLEKCFDNFKRTHTFLCKFISVFEKNNVCCFHPKNVANILLFCVKEKSSDQRKKRACQSCSAARS